MLSISVICLACLGISASAIVCPPDICSQMDCAIVDESSCSDGIISRQGGVCGCCDVCLTEIKEGESCVSLFLFGVPPTSQCTAGTHCDPHTHTCTRKTVKGRSTGTCTEKAQSVSDKLLAAQQAGSPLYGVEVPRCDTDGSYAGIQYIGSQAYCVTKNGTAIDGYMVYRWEPKDMNCQCARDQYNYLQTGLIGKVFQCDSDGSYKKAQCTGSVCYCVDMLGQQQGNFTVTFADMDKLNC